MKLDINDDANEFDFVEQVEQVVAEESSEEIIEVFTSNMMIDKSDDEWEDYVQIFLLLEDCC